MIHTLYNLPEDRFIGGQTCEYEWHLYRESGQAYSAIGCEGKFALIDYSQKFGKPVLEKTLAFAVNSDGIQNVVSVTLEPKDTKDLQGKYIYQISIKDCNGNVEIPGQGIFYISNNINKSYINQ